MGSNVSAKLFNKYYINISYVPSQVNGQQLQSISGVTYSMPTYSSEYYVATMPEAKLFATGSSRGAALTALESIASTASNPGNEPLANIRTT